MAEADIQLAGGLLRLLELAFEIVHSTCILDQAVDVISHVKINPIGLHPAGQ